MKRTHIFLPLIMLMGINANPANSAAPKIKNYAPSSIISIQAAPNRLTESTAYQPMAEPIFEKVEYLSLEPPGYVEQQIESLVNGIKINTAPQYDHYGYEIRRYMAGIAGPEVLASKEKIKQQLINIKKAEIILDHWRKSNNEKVKRIKEEMEKTNARASLRTFFNYQNGTANAFFTEAQSWIDNNYALLVYMHKLDDRKFEYNDPNMIFRERDDLVKFVSILEAQKAARTQIHKYIPFRTMVY